MTTDPTTLQLTERQKLRIHVVGTSGCGKTTMAKQLAELLNYPHVELDRLHWLPNWQEENNDQFRCKLRQAIASDRWILDGNYFSKSVDIQWSTNNGATAVVWCDMSLPRTLVRASRRAFRRAWFQEEVWPGTGNRESFRKLFFSHDSIVLWTLISFRHNRRRYLQVMCDPQYSHIRFVRLRTPGECKRFLNQFRDPSGQSN